MNTLDVTFSQRLFNMKDIFTQNILPCLCEEELISFSLISQKCSNYAEDTFIRNKYQYISNSDYIKYHRNIQEIIIFKCTDRHIKSLNELNYLINLTIDSCVYLKYIDLSFIPNLVYLDLKDCPRLIIKNLNCAQQLRHLNIKRCSKIQKLGLQNMIGLQKLYVQDCSKFTNEGLNNLPNLISLCLNDCPEITGTTINNFMKLESLELQACPKLFELNAEHFSNVKSLIVVKCNHISINHIEKLISLTYICVWDAPLIHITNVTQHLTKLSLVNCPQIPRDNLVKC